MDPSYNNNFGANGSPMAPISSGGDIVLNGGEPEKKPKKGLIIGIVIAVLLVIGGLTAYMLLNETSGQQTQNQTVDVKKAYNSYANYVLSGKDSDGDLSEKIITEQEPYFESLAENERANYVKKAEQKYEELKLQYNGEEDLTILKSYFQDYVSIIPYEAEDLIDLYVTNNGNKNIIAQKIEQHYVTDSDEESLNLYLEAEIELDKLVIDEIDSANAAGCIVNGGLVDNCYVETDELAEAVSDAEFALMLSESSLSAMAMDTLLLVYGDIYDIEIEGEVIDEELVDDEVIEEITDDEIVEIVTDE